MDGSSCIGIRCAGGGRKEGRNTTRMDRMGDNRCKAIRCAGEGRQERKEERKPRKEIMRPIRPRKEES